MISKEDLAQIRGVVKDAMIDSHSELWIPNPEHFQHHQMIRDFIKWSNKFKGTVMGAIIKTVVAGFFLLLAGGLVWFITKAKVG